MPLDVLTRPPVSDQAHDESASPQPRAAEPIGAGTWIAATFIGCFLVITVLPLRLVHSVAGRLSPRARRSPSLKHPISLEKPLLD